VNSFGKRGGRVVEVLLVLLTFGVLCGYMIVIGDNLLPLLKIFHVEAISQRWLAELIVVVPVILPLSHLKSFNSLRFSSFISIVAICYILGLVIFTFGSSLAETPFSFSQIDFFKEKLKAFVAFPILTMAFTFQFNLYPIYTEMANRSLVRFNWLCTLSIFISGVIYLLIGIFGSFTFLGKTHSNILTNLTELNQQTIPTLIASVGFIVVLCFTYPMLFIPCRHNVYLLFLKSYLMDTNDPFYVYDAAKEIPSKILWVIVTFILVFASYGMSLFSFVDLGFVFGIVGATAGILLVYILPATFYLKLSDEKVSHPRKILCIALIIFGASFSVLCTLATVLEKFHPIY